MYEKYLKLLEERGISSYQVCKETGIPQSTISMWGQRSKETPNKAPKLGLDNLLKLARYFDVSLEYFAGE